jgi:hypothetical protein
MLKQRSKVMSLKRIYTAMCKSPCRHGFRSIEIGKEERRMQRVVRVVIISISSFSEAGREVPSYIWRDLGPFALKNNTAEGRLPLSELPMTGPLVW